MPPKEAPVPTPGVRRGDPLIDPQFAVYRRTGFAIVVMIALIAIVFPRSSNYFDINPLAGPLVFLVEAHPVIVLLGALASLLCLGAMLLPVMRPNGLTLFAAMFGVIEWLTFAYFGMFVLVN